MTAPTQGTDFRAGSAFDFDGKPIPDRGSMVAVIGSRAATSYGLHVAGELGLDLAAAGWNVANLGQFGVDGAALRGALVAEGDGRAVAVLQGALDAAPYPAAHRALFGRIVDEGGTLVSPFPAGSPPARGNRRIAGEALLSLVSAVILVESGRVGSATGLADKALQMPGMQVWAVPGPVTSGMSAGPHQLLRSGARLCTSVGDFLEGQR